MIKTYFYISILFCGMFATVLSPLAGAIACLEAYLLNPVVITDSEVRFQLYVTVTFLLSCLVWLPRGAATVGREASVMWALWVFVTIGALSSFWAQVNPQAALDTIYEVSKTVLISSLLVRVVCTERAMSFIVMACLIGVWHAAFMQTFGVRLGYVPESIAAAEAGVLPDMQGSVLTLFLPMLILLAMMGNRLERLISWCSLPFVLNSIVGTNQRTYFVAIVVQLMLLLFFLPRRITLRLLPVLAFGVLLFVFRLTPEDYWKRIGTISDPTKEASANSRLILFEASKNMFRDYPILGVGYRNYPDVSPRYLSVELLTEGRRSAHNMYFTIACEVGITGFVPWAFAFGGSIWLLRRIRKSCDPKKLTRIDVYAMGMEIGLYGWMVGGITQSDHEVDPAYWFVAFSVALTRLRFKPVVKTNLRLLAPNKL